MLEFEPPPQIAQPATPKDSSEELKFSHTTRVPLFVWIHDIDEGLRADGTKALSQKRGERQS